MVLSYLANEMQIQVCAAISRWFTYQNHFTVVFSHPEQKDMVFPALSTRFMIQ
jgi:hypothetical protein